MAMFTKSPPLSTKLSSDDLIELGGFIFTYEEIETSSKKFYQNLLSVYGKCYKKHKDSDPLSREEILPFFSIMRDFGLLREWLEHPEKHHTEKFNLRSDFQHYLNTFTHPQQDYQSYVKFKKKGASGSSYA